MKKTKVTFDNDKLEYSSELLRALAHPLRLQILEFIDKHQEINVNKIYNTLNIEQSITSQHLKVLRMAGSSSIRQIVSATMRPPSSAGNLASHECFYTYAALDHDAPATDFSLFYNGSSNVNNAPCG